MIKYLKIKVCDGCDACRIRAVDGSYSLREHIISREDVTEDVKVKRWGTLDTTVSDVTVKEPASV